MARWSDLAKRDDAVNDLFEFAYVSRPPVGAKEREDRIRQDHIGAAMFLFAKGKEMPHQGRHILRPLA